MRVLIVGAGATGGYFGGRLFQAERDVTFLVREARAAQLHKHGLRLRTPGGDLTLHPPLVTAGQLLSVPAFELVLLSTKAYSLPAAMDDMAPAIGPETAILPILNGMGHLDLLSARFGAGRVLGGTCRIVTDLAVDGWIEQRYNLQQLAFGERAGDPHSPRIERIAAFLRAPGIDATLAEDILATMWQKWWILSSLGATCVLGQGAIGEVAAVPTYGPQLANTVIDEAIAIATANGYPPAPAMLADHRLRLTELGSTMTTSLFRDTQKGLPVEADQIFGDLLARAGTLHSPLLTAAYVQLKAYERRRSARQP